MWRIEEHRRVDEQLASAPREILKRHEKWKDIALPVLECNGESFTARRRISNCFRLVLAERTGIPQATLSAIENDRVRLGVERAKVLAKALKCHPAVLVFPGWQDHLQTAA